MEPIKHHMNRKQMMEYRGVTASQLIARSLSRPKPSPFRPVTGGTTDQHTYALKSFNEYLAAYPQKHQDVSIASSEQWFENEVPFPTEGQINGLLRFQVRRSKPRDKDDDKIAEVSLYQFWLYFCAAWSREGWTYSPTISPRLRQHGKNIVKSLGAEKGLRQEGKERIALQPESILEVSNEIWRPRYNVTYRRRLSIGTFLSIATPTGLRPASIVKGARKKLKGSLTTEQKRKEDGAEGARYGHFQFFFQRDQLGGPNILLGYYRVPHQKNLGIIKQNRPEPLTPGPSLALSALIMVLLSAQADGIVTTKQIRSYFNPDFLQGREFREMRLPLECQDQYLFPSKGTYPLTSKWARLELDQLSVLLGYSQLVDAYCPRHSLIQAMFRSGAALERIRDVANHKDGSTATESYAGKHIVYDPRPQAGVSGIVTHATVASSAYTVDRGAPVEVSKTGMKEVAEETMQYSTDYESVLNAPSSTLEDIKRSKDRVDGYVKRAKKRKLVHERNVYFDQKVNAQAGGSGSGGQSSNPAPSETKRDALRFLRQALSDKTHKIMELLAALDRYDNIVKGVEGDDDEEEEEDEDDEEEEVDYGETSDSDGVGPEDDFEHDVDMASDDE